MAKWMIRCKNTPQFWALPSVERIRIVEASIKTLRADMDAGLIKDWGWNADNGEGYCIMEGTEAQMYEWSVKYSAYVSFEAKPVVSLPLVSELMKKRAAVIRQ